MSFDELGIALLFALAAGLDEEYTSPNLGRLLNVVLTRQMFQFGATLDLLYFLLPHRMALPTDPKDKVFALCGLAADADQNHLDVSRRPVQDVCREVAVRMLIKNGTLDIFSAPNENETSWVPDFTVPIATSSPIRYVGSMIERMNRFPC